MCAARFSGLCPVGAIGIKDQKFTETFEDLGGMLCFPPLLDRHSTASRELRLFPCYTAAKMRDLNRLKM